MTKIVMSALLFSPLMLLTSCETSSNQSSKNNSSTFNSPSNNTSSNNSSSEFETFKSIADDFTTAWNNHDPHAFADLWADDSDLLTPWAKVFKGKTDIEKHFADEHADQMKDSQIKFVIQNVRLIDPNTAFVDADMTITGMTVAGVKADPFHTHAVFLLVKRNGQWKILIARPN